MAKIQLKRSLTQSSMLASSLILAQGEPWTALDTGETRIGDGVKTWANLPSPKVGKGEQSVNVKDFGAAGDNTTDCTSAVQAAHDALAGGGRLFFPAGQYYFAGTVTVSKQITVEGAARGNLGGFTGGVYITVKSGSTTPFVVTIGGVEFTKLAFIGYGLAQSDVTTGLNCAIRFDSGNLPNVNKCSFQSWYRDIWFKSCASWIVKDCYFDVAAQNNIFVQNTALPDWGDQVVHGCTFVSSGSWTTQAQIRQESGGGLKLSDNKFLGATAVRGLDVAVADGVNTSIVLLSNNSFENHTTSAIRVTQAGPSFTGSFFNVVLSGNQFSVRGTGPGVDVVGLGSNSSFVRRVVLTGNEMDGVKANGNALVSIKNARLVSLAANQFSTSAVGVTIDATASDVKVDASNHFSDVDSTVSGVNLGDLAAKVSSRATIYHDPSNKTGAIVAGAVLDSGQTIVNNVGSWPLSYSGGKIVHAPTTVGSSTAGYVQVLSPSGPVRRMTGYVSWPSGALGAAAFVIPSAFWNQSTGTLPIAGFHVTMYGNGLWTGGIWNPTHTQAGHVCEILTLGAATAVTLSVVNTSGTVATSSLSVATMTAASLQSALAALSNVGAGKVTVVSGAAPGAFGVTWSTALSATTMTVSAQTGSGASVIEIPSGVLTYADSTSNGRYATVWDGVARQIDIWLYPETNQGIVYFPDGTNSGMFTHPGIGLFCGSGYAVFELFENNTSASDVPASFGRLSVDNFVSQDDAPAPTKVDVTKQIAASKPFVACDQVNTTSSTISLSGSVPPGTTFAEVVLIGATGGGGSGGCAAAAAAANGGGAASSAGYISAMVPASALGTTWQLTIPPRGLGGASVSTSGTVGNAGATPLAFYSKFGCGLTLLAAYNGSGGSAGTLGATVAAASSTGFPFGTVGVGAPANGAVGSNGVTNSTSLGTAGSASGGGVSSGGVATNGGVGGANLPRLLTGGTAGVVGGAAPGVGLTAAGVAPVAIPAIPGVGVGGGAASASGAAQAGITPTMYGVGGSGGGASTAGFASGAGGDGVGGYILLKFHFS
jgi:hypothetical protein